MYSYRPRTWANVVFNTSSIIMTHVFISNEKCQHRSLKQSQVKASPSSGTLSTFKITLSTVFVPLCASPSEWLAQGYIFNYHRPMKYKSLCESPLKMDSDWYMQPSVQTLSSKRILIHDIIRVSSLLEHQPGIRCWFEPVLLVLPFDSWATKLL